MKSCGVTIQMKATEQYFPVVLLVKLYKVVLTFESVDEVLWCDHSNESYWAVLFHLGFTKNSYFLSCLVRRDYSNLIFISARDKEKASPFHAFHCIPTIPEACVPFRYWAVSWTQRFLRRKFWLKNRSLFMTNKFKRKCLQKFYISSKQEKEWYRKTTSYLEQPSRHFCQHFMRRTTQHALLAINLASQQKTTQLYFFSQVRKQFKLLAIPLKPLRCCLRNDKLVNCHVWKFCKAKLVVKDTSGDFINGVRRKKIFFSRAFELSFAKFRSICL